MFIFFRKIVESENVDIENQISMTHIFPDSSLPEKTNGGFKSQEELKNFVFEFQGKHRWNGTLHARPLAGHLADYQGDTIAQAFPLHFPFGHTGLSEDVAVKKMASIKGNRKSISRNRLDILRKFLQLRVPCFHSPRFNLIVENVILKESVFQSTRVFCCLKHADGSNMANQYGSMTANDLRVAIQAARKKHGSQHSTKASNRFLKSISASCAALPHSNESAKNARRVYFSFLIHCGLPAIFLTVTPDDGRDFRIVLHANAKKVFSFGENDIASVTDNETLADFKLRQRVRESHPGLCAEEHQRIVHLVIKHLFAWDEEKQCSVGKGIFGELEAWCLATEEQGRKTLHGHFLLFIKNWNEVSSELQNFKHGVSFSQAKKQIKTFFNNVCSAQLFSEFGPSKPLSEQAVFHHECTRRDRNPKRRRCTPQRVDDQAFREMHHKKKCNEHRGIIGKCNACESTFSAQDLVENALRCHSGINGNNRNCFDFPSVHNKRLDMHVCELQKDFEWINGDDKTKAIRYFACNALTNFHFVTHTVRCFKKGSECFADSPEPPCETTTITFDAEMSTWTDWCGRESPKGIFRIDPKRNLEDAFINKHNELMTMALGINNNVSAAINGSSVFYCTGYNAKSQQKEEREAHESVSRVMLNVVERQQQENTLREMSPSQLGFRRMLAGIYTHSNSYILAAPMAHYLALNDSRFHFSHDHNYFPVHGLESMLLQKDMVMTFRQEDGKQIPHHRAMDYICRPEKFEDMSPMAFYGETERVSSSKNNTEKYECFDFTEDYPLKKSFVCRKLSKPVVPVLPWNWLPNTKSLGKTLQNEPSQIDTNEFQKREKHALRFLILFSSFRSFDDLMSEGSHQETLRQKLFADAINKSMLKIANNIQNIYNSLDSGRCDNVLNAHTVSPDDIEDEMCSEEGFNYSEEFLKNIGSYIASTSGDSNMVEEAKDLTPQFITEEIPAGSDGQICLDDVQLHDVFHVALESSSNSDSEDNLTLLG